MSFPRSVRITLVRHGESVSNRAHRWQGQGDSPLSELGVQQAKAVAGRLAGRTFDRIVASDLSRASDTAAALGLPFERQRGFREFDVGAWEGYTRDEIAVRFPEELARLANGEDVPLGGGESYASFSQRVDDALSSLASSLSAGQHALVVCHGGVIGALVAGALGLRDTRELPIGRVFNTAISELSYDDAGRATLHVFNDALHLGRLSLFPQPTELLGAVALVCDTAPDPAFGSFAAHYDFEAAGGQLPGGDPSGHALHPVVETMLTRHPGARVSLSARAARIHGWVGGTLFGDQAPSADIAISPRGAICHVHLRDGRLALIDYGVRL